ncbi:MAG: YkgJ family cysteine cluster protein [Deltaproteobacteria bacterium]|nr:YkgJ family cysteine cluster protein [Deltaproteobacteria bacterium]
MILRSFESLCTRIDRFSASVRARYGDQIACQAECADCCQAGLTLVMIEAVAIGVAYGIDAERIHLQAGQPCLQTEGRCHLLNDNDLCTIYENRPLVCRTHGLPLDYSDKDNTGVTYCEKNFISRAPHRSAVLDMTNLETALFAVNLDYCRKLGLNPMARVTIDRLALLLAD